MEQSGTPLFFLLSAVFVVIAGVMMLTGAKKHKVSLCSAGVFAILSVVLGLFFARLIFCINPEKASIIFYDELGQYTGTGAFWQPVGSGFHVGGFILGIFLAALITAPVTKDKFFSLMDSICLPALFLFAAIRFIEPLSDTETLKGFSDVMENGSFCFTPLFYKIEGLDWDTGETIIQWKLAVHLVEAILAVIILFALHRKKFAPGILSMYTAVLFTCSQFLPESLRQDGHLCISIFLRVTYISYAILFGVTLLYLMYRAWKHGVSIRRLATETIIVVICMGLFVVLEFALDGKVTLFPEDFDNSLKKTLIHSFMGVVLAVMALVTCQRIHKENKLCLAE